ncbi:MAG: membrane protein insertase YidC [Bacteroidota bacterium]
MDRNTSIGLILMGIMLFGFFYFSSPNQDPQTPINNSPETQQTDSLTDGQSSPETVEQAIAEEEEIVETDSQRTARLKDKYSDFWTATEGEDGLIKVITEKLTLNISKKGGYIQSAYLNDFKTFDSLPLPVVAPDDQNHFYLQFPYNNRALNSQDLYFEPSETSIEITGTDSAQLSMKAKISDTQYLEQLYTFTGDTYDFKYAVRMKGMKEGLGKVTFYEMNWKSNLPKTEYDIKNMRAKTVLAYKMGGDVEKFEAKDETIKEKLPSLIEWISYKSQFFSHIIVPDKPLRSATLTQETPKDSYEPARIMNSKMILELDRKSADIENNFLVYMGPNEYTSLVSYGEDFEDEMDLGWSFISWINKGTTYVFKFLENYIDNYGIIIIILAIMIRLLVLPLSFRSYVSMAKMRVINQTDEVKALDEKYKDDQQKLMAAKQGLYREMGVSMFGGCLPMLLSYPFLIALFFFFPQSVELRQQSFLWAHDLSTYDSFISWEGNIPIIGSLLGNHLSLFTVLMAISTFIYTFYSQQSQPTAGAAGNQMKVMAYIMPVFLLFFLNSYAAGLSLYYLTSNILQITQTTLIKKLFVNDEKLLAEMRENQKKNKKKGKGGKGKPKSRLERWVEDQQKKQEAMMKERQKQSGKGRSNRRR